MKRTFLAILLWIIGPLAQSWLLNLTLFHLWAASFGKPDMDWRVRWAMFFFALLGGIGILQLASMYFWLVAPAIRRHRRRSRGLCIHCGYDLRGSPTGACPECGAKI